MGNQHEKKESSEQSMLVSRATPELFHSMGCSKRWKTNFLGRPIELSIEERNRKWKTRVARDMARVNNSTSSLQQQCATNQLSVKSTP